MKEKSVNKTEKRKFGDRGEELAASHLEAKGYTVIARNFSCRAGELDIVAVKDGLLCFAEVKTRSFSSHAFGRPCEAVDWKKQRRLLTTAGVFLKLNPQLRCLQPRMDIIEVELIGSAARVNHIESAFS